MKQTSISIKMARLALIQGVYHLFTGIWPLLDITRFVTVTGPKDDLWLVRTVGMLIFFIGTGLLVAGIKKTSEFTYNHNCNSNSFRLFNS